MTIGEYFSGLLGGLKSLATGMSVTWVELFTKKVTQQYPENRKKLVIPPRVRGELTMPHDENNEHACTSCGICQMNCPNGTINIISNMIETEDGKKKKILGTYTYDLGMCTFCNLCVLTCPSDAIKFSTEFENAVFRRKSLKQVLNHDGSKLREKKKVAPATPVAPKAETPKVEPKTSESVDNAKVNVETTKSSSEAPASKPEAPKVVAKPTEVSDTTKASTEEKKLDGVKPETTSVKEESKETSSAVENKADSKIDIVAPKTLEKKSLTKSSELQEKPEVEEKQESKVVDNTEVKNTSQPDASDGDSKNSKTNKE